MESKRFHSLLFVMLMFYVFMVMVINASDTMKSKEEEEGTNLSKEESISKIKNEEAPTSETKKKEAPILKSHYEEIRPRLIWAVKNINVSTNVSEKNPVGFSMHIKNIILKYLGALGFTLVPIQPFPFAIRIVDGGVDALIFHDTQFLLSLSVNRRSLHLSDLTNQFKTVRTFSIPNLNSDSINDVGLYAMSKNHSLVIGSSNALVYLWNTSTGNLITTLEEQMVSNCDFFFNDKRIVTGRDYGFSVWETETNQYNCLRVKPVHDLSGLVVTAENEVIIYTTFSCSQIKIYNSSTDQNIRVLEGQVNSPPRADASIMAIDNNQIFVSMDYGNEIKLWNIITGESTKTIPPPGFFSMHARIRYASSKWLVWSASWQKADRVRVWNLKKDTYIDIKGGTYIAFMDVRYDKDLIIGSYKKVNAENLQMEIYSLETGKLMQESKK